jgi:hypothetical protein
MVRKICWFGVAQLAAACVLSGCASTTLLSTWREPGVGQLSFQKVLVIAPSHDPSLRRAAEEELARRIKRAQAIPSYTLIPEAELENDEAVRARAKSEGFDGVVVMRVVSVDKQATWVPGAWTGRYYAYGGWPAYDPGQIQINTYVRVETNVYSARDDKLVWASASRTTNPSNVNSLVASTAKAVGKEMKKQGLIP